MSPAQSVTGNQNPKGKKEEGPWNLYGLLSWLPLIIEESALPLWVVIDRKFVALRTKDRTERTGKEETRKNKPFRSDSKEEEFIGVGIIATVRPT